MKVEIIYTKNDNEKIIYEFDFDEKNKITSKSNIDNKQFKLSFLHSIKNLINKEIKQYL